MLVVTVLCVKQNEQDIATHEEGNELHRAAHFQLLTVIGYQMISADKLDDHGM